MKKIISTLLSIIAISYSSFIFADGITSGIFNNTKLDKAQKDTITNDDPQVQNVYDETYIKGLKKDLYKETISWLNERYEPTKIKFLLKDEEKYKILVKVIYYSNKWRYYIKTSIIYEFQDNKIRITYKDLTWSKWDYFELEDYYWTKATNWNIKELFNEFKNNNLKLIKYINSNLNKESKDKW